MRQRLRRLAKYYQAHHTARAVDNAPQIARSVQTEEQVIREQGRKNALCFTGMAHGLAIARAEHALVLPLEVDDGAAFGARLGMSDIPALTDEFIG